MDHRPPLSPLLVVLPSPPPSPLLVLQQEAIAQQEQQQQQQQAAAVAAAFADIVSHIAGCSSKLAFVDISHMLAQPQPQPAQAALATPCGSSAHLRGDAVPSVRRAAVFQKLVSDAVVKLERGLR